MPPVIAAAALSAGIAAAEGVVVFGLSTTLSALVIGAGSLILGGLQYALAPKPKKSNFSSADGVTSSTTTIRQADSTRKHVYGLTRFTDCYAQSVSTGVNGKLHFIVLICSDEADSVVETWVDDYPISPDQIDANGNVIAGRYAGALRIRFNMGSDDQVADPVAVAEVDGWTSSCRLRGIFYAFVTLTKNQDVYPNGVPNFSFIFRGRKIYDPRIATTRWTPNASLFCYDFLNKADFGFQALDADVNTTNISAQANISDEIVDTVNLDMPLAAVDTATNIMTLTGTVLSFETADRVEIISTGTAPGGLSTGVDYYVIPYQIKTTPRIKLATTLDNAIAGIAIDITSAGTGTITVRKNGEPRYHGAGVVDTADTLEDSFNSMLTAIAGRASLTGGAWRLLAGAWQEPTLDLTEADMRGGVGTRTKIAMAERFNTISGVYISQLNNFQAADYPQYRNQAYIDNDLSEYPKDYPLNFTSRPTTAKRITKLETIKARLEKIFTVPCSMKGMLAQAGDNVQVTYSRRGWEEKIFEMTNFGFKVVTDDSGNNQLLTSLTLRETAESIYDWAASEDDPPLNLAPNTNLPDPFTVPAVSGMAFSSRATTTVGADTIYNLVLSWDESADAFVISGGQVEIQFKKSSEVDWRPSFFVSGTQTFSDIVASSVNVQYDLRARNVNNLGVRSNWNTILNCTVGSSGGVGATNNWGLVSDSVGASIDYGLVSDAVGATNDWGFVV